MRAITFRGKTQSLPAWSRETGIPESTIRSRLVKLGLSIEEALTRPPDARFRSAGPRDLAPAPRSAPRLRKDDRGRGFARWTEAGTRRKKIFGPWGDPETVAAYSRWAAEWHAAQGTPAESTDAVSVASLIVRYIAWAETHYRKHGRITSEVHGIRAALADLNELYGCESVAEFSPIKMIAVQQVWIARKLTGKTANDYLHRVRRCFSWGVSRGLVPASVPAALEHVSTLKPGRMGLAWARKVTSAPADAIASILPHLHTDEKRRQVLAAAVLVQLHTGMRPGEVLALRPMDLDRNREPWRYTPVSKTYHLDRDREVWIGPRAREILAPLLAGLAPEQPVFAVRRLRGKGTVRIRVEWYRACIAAACQAAGVQVFTPHQIRHASATEIQRLYEDDEAVAAMLGNTPEVSRQVYVDAPGRAVARRIAEAVG